MTSTVVVGYDRAPAAELALLEAATEAELRGATLAVIHVVRRGDTATQIAEEGTELARAGHPGLAVDPRTLDGSTPAVLAEQAQDADLLVVGHRGRGGFAGLGIGSTAMRAVSHATAPTMVVRGSVHQPRGTVLAAVDLTDPADGVIGFACDEAERRNARLRVVSSREMLWPWPHAGDNGQLQNASRHAVDAADSALDRLTRPWQERHPAVQIEHELVDGQPAAVLTTASESADLIVTGGHRPGHHVGRHGGTRLGPVVHALLSQADCPVVVVPHS